MTGHKVQAYQVYKLKDNVFTGFIDKLAAEVPHTLLKWYACPFPMVDVSLKSCSE